jgi:hypothetical protein
MAAKKKTKKKQLKKTAAKGRRPVTKTKTVGKKRAKKRAPPTKKSAKKKVSLKQDGVKTKAPNKKKADVKTARAGKRPMGNQRLDAEMFSPQESRARSAGQSGDLQGLTNVEGADSESVDELLEEGNAFEADVVAGVQSAGDADEKEVHTHEVPEDDVPGEYLDKD